MNSFSLVRISTCFLTNIIIEIDFLHVYNVKKTCKTHLQSYQSLDFKKHMYALDLSHALTLNMTRLQNNQIKQQMDLIKVIDFRIEGVGGRWSKNCRIARKVIGLTCMRQLCSKHNYKDIT